MINVFKTFSFEAYHGIVKERFSKCVQFFCILIVGISVLISFQFTMYVKTKAAPQANFFIKNMLTQLADGFPETEIQNGVLIAPQKTFIRELKAEGLTFAFIIEPDEGTARALLEKYQNCMVLTKTKVISKSQQRPGETKIEEYDLAKVALLKIMPVPDGFKLIPQNNKEFILTPETAGNFLKKVMLFVWPAAFLFLLVYFCVAKIMQVLFFSLISLIINAVSDVRLSYMNLLTIGVYALGPPTITVVVLQFLNGRPVPGQSLLFIGIYVLYLYMGIKANKVSAPVEGKV